MLSLIIKKIFNAVSQIANPRKELLIPDWKQTESKYLSIRNYGCNYVCLSNIANYYAKTNINPDDKYVLGMSKNYIDKNAYVLNPEGIFTLYGTFKQLKKIASLYCDIRSELSSGIPVICSMQTGTNSFHFIVVKGFDENVLTINDPLSRDRFIDKELYLLDKDYNRTGRKVDRAWAV